MSAVSTYSCTKIQRRWRRYKISSAIRLQNNLVEHLTCSICFDVHPVLYRCGNGHGTCLYCHEQMKERLCAMCRNTIDYTVDSTTSAIASTCEIKVKCGTCNRRYDLRRIEQHRSWCPEYEYMCPTRDKCMQHFRASDLIKHLVHHDQDVYRASTDETLFFTCLSQSLQYFLVIVDDVIVVVQTVGQRNDHVDTNLMNIGLCMKAYYTSKRPTWLSASIRHHHPRRFEKILEHFEIECIPAVTALTERHSHQTVASLTTRMICKDTSLVYKPQVTTEPLRVMKTFTRSMRIEPWTTECNVRSTFKMFREWEEVALTTLTFTKTQQPIY